MYPQQAQRGVRHLAELDRDEYEYFGGAPPRRARAGDAAAVRAAVRAGVRRADAAARTTAQLCLHRAVGGDAREATARRAAADVGAAAGGERGADMITIFV